MEEDQTLLQQIREKEAELSRQIDKVREETEAMTAAAKNEAKAVIERATETGKSSAAEQTVKEKADIAREVENIKRSAEEKAGSTRAKGERNLPVAVDLIVKSVTME